LISQPVLCELEWVLESVYAATRKDILATMRMLLTTPPFEVEDAALLERALARYARGKADLSDFIIGESARSGGAATTHTFDKALRAAEGFSLL
jgi:predicted nucleic-acid-binding protein